MAYQSSQQFQWHYSDFEDSNFQIRGRALFFIIILISLLLIITVVFLYARWICRYNRITPPSTTNSDGNIRHAPPDGLDSDSISSFPITLYRQLSENETTECSICLGIFAEGDKVKVLTNCRHCYHSECVDKWLLTHSSCPLCRGSLRVDSVV